MCSLCYCSPPTQDVGGLSPQLHCTSAPQYILLSDPPKAMDKDFFSENERLFETQLRPTKRSKPKKKPTPICASYQGE